MSEANTGINAAEGFSLRMTRGLLVLTIVVGIIALIGGLVVAGGAWLTPEPAREPAPPSPTPTVFTVKIAETWLDQHAGALDRFERSTLAASLSGSVPAELASLFPDPPYAKEDEWESFCRVPTDYGCLEKSRRLKRTSAGRTFAALFQESDGEFNPSDVIPLLANHLPHVALEQRLRMVVPIALAGAELKRRNAADARAHELKLEELAVQHKVKVAEHRDKQMSTCMAALWAAAWGLGAVMSAGVFVAILAIERHLRALRSAQAAARGAQ